MKKKNRARSTTLKSKKINKISSFFGIILLIVNIVLFYTIFKLNIIPIKYLKIIVIVSLVILLLLELFLLNRHIKKKIKIVSIVFSIVLILLFSFIEYYLYNTYDFISKFKFKDYQIETYYVVVLDNNGYDELEDLKNSKIGVLDAEFESKENAKTELAKEIDVTYKEVEDTLELSDKLLDDEIDAILVSSVYKDFYDENVAEFKEKTKIIYTIEIKVLKENIVKQVNVSREPFTIYLSGIDVSGDITTVSRSDVNMLITVNPETNTILLTSIPRDYYVQLHGTTGYKDKLTHSGTYGINMTIQTVEDLLDVDINYYVRVNFTTVIKLVDEIGGIDVYSDASFTPWTNRSIYIKKGLIHMNGEMALAFARERYAYLEGDRHRIQNQQDVLEAIINKITSASTLTPSTFTSLLNTLGGCFETNLSQNEISSLIRNELNDLGNYKIEKYSLNGTDSSNYTYSYGQQLLYVMEPDYTTVEEAKIKIKEVIQGV